MAKKILMSAADNVAGRVFCRYEPTPEYGLDRLVFFLGIEEAEEGRLTYRILRDPRSSNLLGMKAHLIQPGNEAWELQPEEFLPVLSEAERELYDSLTKT